MLTGLLLLGIDGSTVTDGLWRWKGWAANDLKWRSALVTKGWRNVPTCK